MKPEELLRECAMNAGADVFGIGYEKSIRNLPQEYQEYNGDWKSVVVVGLRVPLAIIEHITPEEPGKIYSYEYNVISEQLDRIVFNLIQKIEDMGSKALPIPARGGYPPLGGSLLAMARAAGIGCLGKNQLIINNKFGSRLRFAALVTDKVLEGHNVENTDLCKNCVKCIEACPANAIKDIKMENSDIRGNVDREACWNYIKQFLEKPGYGKTICGACIEACPYSYKLAIKEKL